MRLLVCLVLLGGFLSCGRPPENTLELEPSDLVAPEVLAEVQQGGQPLALVELVEPGLGGQALGGPNLVWTDEELTFRASLLTTMKASVRDAVPSAVEEGVFGHLPVLALRISSLEELVQLAAHPRVKRVHANQAYQSTLTESLSLINQPQALANGLTGAGTSVAVLDTGLDYTRAAFGSCASPGVPDSCRVPVAMDFAPDDGALDAHGHGTNVSGIVAGVASGTRVLGLDVFSGGLAYSNHILAAIDWCVQNRATYNIVAINMSLGGGLYSAPCGSDVFASGVATAKSAGILSAIASGNNASSTSISSPGCVPEAVSVGAVYDSNVGSRGWSACSDATTAADKVTCFSNSASFLSLVAPGSLINAAGIGMSGTSQAAPHVAGGLAVIAAAYPGEAAATRLARLLTSGTTVLDTRNGVTKPRLDLVAAVSGCAWSVSPSSSSVGSSAQTLTFSVSTSSDCAWTGSSGVSWMTIQSGGSGTGSGTVTVALQANTGTPRSASLAIAGRTVPVTQAGDSTPPSGTVTIAGGAAWTRSPSVTLALAATDNGTVSSMCITNTSTCSSWRAYATSIGWTLTSGSGPKTVRVFFKDSQGNMSAAASDEIGLDTTLPVNGTGSATNGDGQVGLSWTGFSDAHSGVASYKVVSATGSVPPNCSSGTVVYSGSDTSTTHQSLQNGLSLGYRVCAVDTAGNVSAGATATARTAPEFAAPTGTVVINDDAAWANRTTVQLAVTATDASGVSQLCASNSTSCSLWRQFSPSVAWTLVSGSGSRTVRVWFKDAWGNVSDPVSDSINLDTTAPSSGSVSLTRGDGVLTASWSGFTDAVSGVASYTVVFGPNGAPPNCLTGTVVVADTSQTSAEQGGLTNGGTYGLRVCARDVAGNLSSGVEVRGIPAPELVGPTSSVSIVGGPFTRSSTVSLALSASDSSGVSAMCLSTSFTCSSWTAYASSANFTLASGSGTRTVYARFRDPWGNESSSATASIVVDLVAPTSGTLTATAGVRQVALSWSGISDSVSGVAAYKLVWAAGTVAPASCSTGTTLVSGLTASVVHSGLSTGQPISYRLCATDNAGNTSKGLTRTVTPL